MQYVAIDFETANRFRHSPCSIGLAVYTKEGQVDEFYSLINPMMQFDAINKSIHGISEKDVLNSPTFDEIWPSVENYISGRLVVAHNASFDISVLRHTLDHFRLPHPEFNYMCTVSLSRKVWPGLPNYKLNTLASFKNISFTHHNALEDAQAAGELFRHALIETESDQHEELVKKLKMKRAKKFIEPSRKIIRK